MSQKSYRKDQNGQYQKRINLAARKHATSRANSKQEQDQVVVTHQKEGTNGSPEQSTLDPTRMKANKSLGGCCTDMVQRYGNPDGRREQLGQGETLDINISQLKHVKMLN